MAQEEMVEQNFHREPSDKYKPETPTETENKSTPEWDKNINKATHKQTTQSNSN